MKRRSTWTRGRRLKRVQAARHGPRRPRIRSATEPHHRRCVGRAGNAKEECSVGQKVHPIGFRLGHHQDLASSSWYAEQELRRAAARGPQAPRSTSRRSSATPASPQIEIERAANKLKINIHTARPGIVIGKKGAEIDKLKKELAEADRAARCFINIQEVRKPEIDAQLVAENVAHAARAARRLPPRHEEGGAVGAAVRRARASRSACSGRLGGAEIARTEWYREGRVPLHTLRADIDYGFAEARTTYGDDRRQGAGSIKGEVLPQGRRPARRARR
ncbi:MAG: 30S ribosomal protein S3 [Desulfobacterales bacterium]|nr:30S ribosomal protein S3 [Desulfobacterales bacterium]